MRHTTQLRLLQTTAILLALGCGGAALAQTTSSTADAANPQVEEVVVTGERGANKNAISAERKDTQIVSVISSDDIGKMTDFNAGEALRRVPGVNVWTYLGEPRFVTIRGFNASYNTTTMDGFQMASPDNANYGSGRQFYMDALPSAVASKITVYKTYSPDMEGHFLGGAVDFSVPDALEYKENRLNLNLDGGINLNKDAYGGNRPTYDGGFLITHKFGSNDQFGVSLTASYWNREMNISDTEIGGNAISFGPTLKSTRYTVIADPYDGTYGPYPAAGTFYNYDDTRQRKSIVGKFTWKKSEAANLSLGAYYLEQDEHFLRNEWTASPSISNTNFGALNPTVNSVQVNQTASQYQLLNSSFKRQMYGVNGTFKYALSGKLNATVLAGYSGAYFSNPQLFDRFVLPASSTQYYQVTQQGNVWNWAPIGSAFQSAFGNLASYNTASGGRNLQERFRTHAQVTEFQGRLDYNMDPHDFGLGLTAGVKYETNSRRDDYDRTDYGNASNGIALSTVFSGQYLSANGCNQCIALINPVAVQQAIQSLPSAPNASAAGNRFTTDEDRASGWLMGRWKGDRWEADVGFRIESTNYSTTGFQNVTGGTGLTGWQPVSASDKFTNFLPSFTFIYDTAEDMRDRFAYSRTIGRPSLTQKSLRGGALDFTQNPPTLTQGNPDLKPLVSDNFDVIHEFYFDNGQGVFTVGGFYKLIQDEIYIVKSVQTISAIQYYAQEPLNSPYQTKVYGGEANFVKNLTFLPGFLKYMGFQANGFIMGTQFPIPLSNGQKTTLDILPDQAKYGVNLALFYEVDNFSARVAWNRTGLQWDGRVSGATNLPGADNPTAATLYKRLFDIPVDSLSFKIAYTLDDRYTVSFSGNNLLGQGASANIGNNQEIPARVIKVPATLLLGLSANL